MTQFKANQRIAAQMHKDHIATMALATIEDCLLMHGIGKVAIIQDGQLVGFEKE